MNEPIISTEDNSSDTPSTLSKDTTKSLDEITKILFIVSSIFIIGVISLNLDFLDGTLLSIAVVGFNFFLTRQAFIRIFLLKGLKQRIIVLYVLKLGISGIALYLAIVEFGFSRIGLLIGLSNIVIAILVFSIKQALFPSST